MDTKILHALGLNDAQTRAYLFLIKHGGQTPPLIATGINESRTNVYNVLNQLEELGLIEKDNQNKTHYHARNPSALRQLLIKRNQELSKTSAELNAVLPTLQSAYRLTYDQPGVVHADGAAALQMIYDDVIKNGNELLVFPSKFDRDNPETSAIIDSQIARQQKAGLGSKVLLWSTSRLADRKASLHKQGIDIAAVLQHDLPAQIMIYGDNVAFTTFHNGVSSTVITNPEIAETMRRIFLELWPAREPATRQTAPQAAAD